MYFDSAMFASFARSVASSVRSIFEKIAVTLRLQYAISLSSPPHPYSGVRAEMDQLGLDENPNIMRSQSRDGRVVPKRTPLVWNRGTISMPTLLSCFCMISNVSARSWLPVVVKKRNESLPVPGHEKMSLLLALGLSGPPVQPPFFSRLMTFC